MAIPNLACLPAEILDVICESCQQHDLLSLNRLSRALYRITAPLLYRLVNVSTHNREHATIPRSSTGMELWADVDPLCPPPVAMIRRQHSFLITLLMHPGYGRYVRSFTWTLIFASDIKGEGARLPAEKILQYPETKIWEAFRSMVNIEKLDLASLHYYYKPYLLECPSSLFSSASSIRLLGRFSFRLASAIVHAVDATKLKQLSLDDVQDWGQYADGTPTPASEGRNLNRRTEHQNPDGTRGLVFSGPMRGLLPLLKDRCLFLTHLFLRKAGQIENSPRMKNWSAPVDEEVYAEWAAFIESVKSSLKVLILEHGTATVIQHRRNRMTGDSGRPMDIRARRFLLSVLTNGGWSSLQKMELRGIGVERGMQRHLDQNVQAIEGAIGPSAELVMVKWAQKPCPKFNGFEFVPYFDQ